MRVSILGKGGSGKTSITTYLANYFSNHFKNVVAIDGDINVHLGEALGFTKKPIALGDRYNEIFEYLFSNRSDENIPKVGTIPPSMDSNFIRLNEDDNFLKKFSLRKGNKYLLNIDTYTEDEIGVNCFHGRINSLELMLHYFLDTDEDLVLIDSTAGTDSVSSSMHFSSDLYLFVVEPTLKSINVYKDYKQIIEKNIKDDSVKLKVIINKYYDNEDLNFISKHFDMNDILAKFPYNKKEKRKEQGSNVSFDDLIGDINEQLQIVEDYILRIERDWDNYLQMLKAIFVKKMKKTKGDSYESIVTPLLNNNFSYSQVL